MKQISTVTYFEKEKFPEKPGPFIYPTAYAFPSR
jgi:hypothetical protein